MINDEMVKTVKKQKENNDSASSLPDDVFSDDFNSPEFNSPFLKI